MRSPASSTGVPFTPRKEFVRDPSLQFNDFALLALSSHNCIRLYSFDDTAVEALRNFLLQGFNILNFRKDPNLNLFEFVLDARPWANPRSFKSEKLLVDVISVIYEADYTYTSTIDYGRESDDHLAMIFSKPSSPSQIPNSSSHNYESTRSSVSEKPKAKPVLFAISFVSERATRVISPPLHLTPAIFQAIRVSWPRGVTEEIKIGQNSFEMKLKGYGLLEQNTFATDSLHYILSLLACLDQHSVSLLTSISLTNRSRSKDMWIFSSLPPEEDSASNSGVPDQVLTGQSGQGVLENIQEELHRKLPSDPDRLLYPVHPHSPSDVPQQSRDATADQPLKVGLLRKPAPRAQIPVSVVHEADIPEIHQSLRANLPSTLSSDVENMTGIGSANVTIPPIPGFRYGRTPEAMKMSSLNPSYVPPAASSTSPVDFHVGQSSSALSAGGYGAFRGSEFSTNSEMSREIPIKWSGPAKDESMNKDGLKNEGIGAIREMCASGVMEKGDRTLWASEGALARMIQTTSTMEPTKASGSGWVMVDVDSRDNEERTARAKAIVVLDAIERGHRKSRSLEEREGSRRTTVRRLFSLNRKKK